MAEQRNHKAPSVILLLFFFSTVISTNPACNKMDQDSLRSFSFNMPSSPLNWSSNDCCNWDGITCDAAGRVTHVLLPSKGLKGGIFVSSSLGNLTHLTHLDLSHNSLYGSLDQTQFFSSLSRLQTLNLSNNLLSGELPYSQPLSNIRVLDLSSNHFHGEIASSFFQQARNLMKFNVSHNTFIGSIPSSVCLRSSSLIQVLDFSFNNFNGSISRGLGVCSKLQAFRAGYNNLSGLLPDDIYNATTLEEIALPRNSLHGALSEGLVNLTNLTILDLSYNEFIGVVPASIGKLSKLQFVLLDYNMLEGYLPPSLMNCTNLIELRMGSNNLKGNISLLNFLKLSQLRILDLGKNHFTGKLPMSLYSCKSLTAIRLNTNDLEGEIHPEILALESLSFLSLGGNRFHNINRAMKILMRFRSLVFLSLAASFEGEEMPVDLGMVDFDGFRNLRMLSLGGSDLTGEIPLWFSKLRKLEVLSMGHNRITGSIPSWLGTLPRLVYISLDFNLISGEFPKELCTLPMLVSERIAAQVDDNDLELPIYGIQGPTFLQWKLSNFGRGIYLGNNAMNGHIPKEISKLQRLQHLQLDNNNFSGNIPDQISNLKNLEELSLSWNHLSGKIPSSLTSLNFLSSLDVSYNNLEGQIPTSTQLQSFNASAFEGNPKLCGAPLPNKCLPSKGNEADDNSEDHVENGHQWFHLSVALGFITGFWGVCGPLVLNEKWRYAYFQFLQNAHDRLYASYVLTVMFIAKIQRRLRS
ncbi:hypothetical protein M0R45_017925 [Rubus argutus]|uniref:Leucine-rich repeat-containing N-terminal plant-type domain-containing protein n=1 Tax=Rubus argutus TaxID=59490 RepID=A0AAW1XXC7_RUBAR